MAKNLAGRDLKICMNIHTTPMYLHAKLHANRLKDKEDRAIYFEQYSLMEEQESECHLVPGVEHEEKNHLISVDAPATRIVIVSCKIDIRVRY